MFNTNKKVMIFKTIETYLHKNTISLPKNFTPPSKKIKILVTFIEQSEDIDYNLYELPKNEVTKELLLLSKKTLKKDKSSFTNIWYDQA